MPLSSRALLAAPAAALFALAACASTEAAIPQVRVRAASDLDCPEEDVRIVDRLGGRYDAIGCGRKTTYRTICHGVRCDVAGEGEPAGHWRDRPTPDEVGR